MKTVSIVTDLDRKLAAWCQASTPKPIYDSSCHEYYKYGNVSRYFLFFAIFSAFKTVILKPKLVLLFYKHAFATKKYLR